jgi:GNAT superfamily N-acetyltransferase
MQDVLYMLHGKLIHGHHISIDIFQNYATMGVKYIIVNIMPEVIVTYIYHKLLESAAILSIIFASNTSFTAAADNKSNLCSNLTRTVEVIQENPLRVCVTYYLGETKAGTLCYGQSLKDTSLGLIDKITVKKKFRSQGLGSHLLNQALEDLKHKKYTAAQLIVIPFKAPCKDYRREHEKLLAFYKKNGFIPIDPSGNLMQKTL